MLSETRAVTTSTLNETYTSETIRALLNRVSLRKYTDQPVTDEAVEAVLSAAFRAPTSSNIQSYTVIVVRNPDTLAKLAAIAGNQRHVAIAPVFLAFCADMTRVEHAMKLHGHTLDDNNLEVGLVSSVDAAIVGMSAYIAAESIGLQGLMIGAVRNDALATAEVLGLPKRVYCVFGLCLGWPAEKPKQKPRMDISSIIHSEKYDAARALSTLPKYDAELAAHYQSTGRPTTPDSWTHDMDKKFNARLRNKLREQLSIQGFDFR